MSKKTFTKQQHNFLKNKYTMKAIVKHWPSTEPSIKRCTCVNKQKNSGSRWTLENNITRCPGGLGQLETGCRSENQLQTDVFGPLVNPGWATQTKIRKKCCYGREKYSSPSLSPLISYTQQISPFKNSVGDLYKEVYSFVIEVVQTG